MPLPRDGIRGGRAVEPRGCLLLAKFGLVQVPFSAEFSAAFHPAVVFQTLDCLVGLHHLAGVRGHH